MVYDISKSIPQGGNGEETEENRRILEVANELHRRCELYEAQLRDGQANGIQFEVEQRAILWWALYFKAVITFGIWRKAELSQHGVQHCRLWGRYNRDCKESWYLTYLLINDGLLWPIAVKELFRF